MSGKKESGMCPKTRPSLKVSIPIEIYLKRKENMRKAALLQKQRVMLNKMKEDHKLRETIATTENKDIEPKKDDKPNVDDGNKGQKRAPEAPPEPKLNISCGSCQPGPQRPKRPRRMMQVGYGTRARGPQRPRYCDVNNNIPMEQRAVPPANRPPAPKRNVPQNPIIRPGLN